MKSLSAAQIMSWLAVLSGLATHARANEAKESARPVCGTALNQASESFSSRAGACLVLCIQVAHGAQPEFRSSMVNGTKAMFCMALNGNSQQFILLED